MITHYIPPFTKVRGRGIHQMQLAFCNTWVEDAQHSCEPSCEQCKELLEQDAADLADLQAMGPCEHPVASTFGDPLADYHPRERAR